ncbi:MAG: hypothetical protein KF832_20060 [Caldilineaceae bacterium]|nr:hypothetical protein [Caldilineaceae bacterium]
MNVLQAAEGVQADEVADDQTVTPIPTVALLFRTDAVILPTPSLPALVLVPTATPVAPVKATPVATDYREVVVYGDELDANWSVEHSTDTQINLWDTSHWFQPLQGETTSGATSIVVSPQADYGKLLFSVRPESGLQYKRNDVIGVSFWLNSGQDGITTADLAVTLQGSNDVPYWQADDRSVFGDSTGEFSETRLYYLDINRTIPPNTWVNVIVWLNQLQFDPAYQYVTGFYIKNDLGFRNTYYIDQVSLLMAP